MSRLDLPRLAAALVLAAIGLALAACRGPAGGAEMDSAAAAASEAEPELTVVTERPVDPPLPDPPDQPILPPPLVRLGVGNVERSADFYRDLLGFTRLEEPPGSGDPGSEPSPVRLVRGGLRLELLPARGTAAASRASSAAPAAGTPLLLVEVPDAAALFDRVGDQAALVRALTDRPDGHREFSIADPDGHLLVFRQPFGSAARAPG